MWDLIAPSQVREQLRLLHQPVPGGDARHGMCAVVYEAPWQGRPALWIEAVAYHHGVQQDAISLVRPRDGRAVVTQVMSGISGGRPARTASAADGPAPARPAVVSSPASPRSLKAPSFSPRGTFWLWFFLTVLWPLLLVLVIIDFRRAEARDGSGGRYIKAAALGGLTSCALGLALFAVAWFAFFSSVSGGPLPWTQQDSAAGGTSASPPMSAPGSPTGSDPALSAVMLATADLPTGSEVIARAPFAASAADFTNISPPSCADLLRRWVGFLDGQHLESDVTYAGHTFVQRVRRAGPEQLESMREMAGRCPSITYEEQGHTRYLGVQGLPLETDPSIDTVAVVGTAYTVDSADQTENHLVLAHHNGVVMSLASDSTQRPDAQLTYAITDLALRKLRDNAR